MMFGSVARGFLDCQTTGLAGKQLSGVLRRDWPQGTKGWGLVLFSHWPLSHQHQLRLLGLVGVDPRNQDSAARGEHLFCRGARVSSGLGCQPQPTP